VLFGTVIVPVAFTAPHPPVSGIVVECSDTVGVPLIVMVFEANAAVTPAGNPTFLFPLLQLLHG
jgi:hypothetical protein